MDVPFARRLDLGEVLLGREVADPSRRLEGADSPETRSGRLTRDVLTLRPAHAGLSLPTA